MRSVHKTEASKGHGARRGAILEEEIGYLDRTVFGFKYVSLDLRPQAGSWFDKHSLERVLARDFEINPPLHCKSDRVIHTLTSTASG
jgi:hypothetical protein